MSLEWVTIVQQLGIPAIIIIALGVFGYKALWPFLVSQVNSGKEEAAKERIMFLAALERRDREFEKVTNTLDKLVGAVDSIQAELKQAMRHDNGRLR